MLDETGCAGVSIGRGAFYNPWIFQHTLRTVAANFKSRPRNLKVAITRTVLCRARAGDVPASGFDD